MPYLTIALTACAALAAITETIYRRHLRKYRHHNQKENRCNNDHETPTP